MAKRRVHEIAKERGISSKEVIAILQKAGLDVKTAAQSVDEGDIARAFNPGAQPTNGDGASGAGGDGGAAAGQGAARGAGDEADAETPDPESSAAATTEESG